VDLVKWVFIIDLVAFTVTTAIEPIRSISLALIHKILFFFFMVCLLDKQCFKFILTFLYLVIVAASKLRPILVYLHRLVHVPLLVMRPTRI